MGHYVFSGGVLKRVDDGPAPKQAAEAAVEDVTPKKRPKKSKAQDLSVLTGNEEQPSAEDTTPAE